MSRSLGVLRGFKNNDFKLIPIQWFHLLYWVIGRREKVPLKFNGKSKQIRRVSPRKSRVISSTESVMWMPLSNMWGTSPTLSFPFSPNPHVYKTCVPVREVLWWKLAWVFSVPPVGSPLELRQRFLVLGVTLQIRSTCGVFCDALKNLRHLWAPRQVSVRYQSVLHLSILPVSPTAPFVQSESMVGIQLVEINCMKFCSLS